MTLLACHTCIDCLSLPSHCRTDKPTSSGFYARRLTFDHRAEDEGEQERITAAGGFVTRGRYAMKFFNHALLPTLM